MNLPDIETTSALVHDAWMESKRKQGVNTRKSEDGEELMVPYSQLTEKAKDLDRGTVKSVYAAIESTPSGPEKSVDELAKETIENVLASINGPTGHPLFDTEKCYEIAWFVVNDLNTENLLAASPKGKEEDAELLELRDWKESAMNVMADMQEIGKELGVKLGESIHDKILPAIIDYKKRLGTTG